MNRDEAIALIQAMLDGTIAEAERSRLEAELADSETLRQIYVEYSQLHSLLEQRAAISPAANQIIPIDRIVREQRRRSVRIAVMATAALIMISLVSLWLITAGEQVPTLTFRTSPGTEFTLTHRDDHADTAELVMENGSRLKLERGTLELSFSSGVRSIVTSPADLRLVSDDTLKMKKGTAWFQVPEQAKGFTVQTKDLTVVDLGTEFGVIAHGQRAHEVHVFKGKVRVTAKDSDVSSLLLVANQARRLSHQGKLEEIPATPTHFSRTLTDLPPFFHWSFDENFDASGTHPDVDAITSIASPPGHPPTLEEGRIGNALSLDGTQQSVVTDWNGIFHFEAPISTSVWVQIPVGADLTLHPAIVGWGIPKGSKAKWKLMVRHDGAHEEPTAVFVIGSNRGLDRFVGESPIADGKWHHIAAVSHGGMDENHVPAISLYVDGRRESVVHSKQVGEGRDFENVDEILQSPDIRPVVIGKGPVEQDRTFHGLIDELYIFEGAISQETITALANPELSTPTTQ